MPMPDHWQRQCCTKDFNISTHRFAKEIFAVNPYCFLLSSRRVLKELQDSYSKRLSTLQLAGRIVHHSAWLHVLVEQYVRRLGVLFISVLSMASSRQQLPAGFDPVYFARVTNATAVLEGDPETAPRMERLRRAFNVFSSGGATASSNVMDERVYMELYLDIKVHWDLWFDRIYDPGAPMSYVFCEWSVGILGTLTTIRRQRNDLKRCLEVLQLYTEVLERYQALTADKLSRDPNMARCVASLTYKYNLVASNAHQQARNREPGLKAFRAGARYEIEQRFDFDSQQLAFMIKDRADLMGKNYMSVKFLDETPDDHIWSNLMQSLLLSESSGGIQPRKAVVPWICDGCGDEEELCGDYKRCVACGKAYYCSRPCQVKHWKMHKPDCKKKTPNISLSLMTSIKKASQSTIRNYSQALKLGDGVEVSKDHIKAAFPILVQSVKNYVLEHPHLDSEKAFINAEKDVQFRQQVDAIMAAQPGFEALLKGEAKPKTEQELLKVIEAEQLVIHEENMVASAKRAVAGLAPVFAALNMAPDAQELDRAHQHVVSSIKSYVSKHPEYQAPENFEQAAVEGKMDEVAASAVTEFFNIT